MRTVRLAGTPLVTSRLGFGTATLHHLPSSAARQRLLEHARTRGIRYFDTAPLYGHESAEREIGRFARRGRTDLLLTTKTGIVPDPLMSRIPALLYARLAGRQLLRRAGLASRTVGKPPRDYAAGYTRTRVERSLRLLGTDYIDVLYLHEPSLAMISDPDGLAAELAQLKASGKVRHVGISGFVQDALDIASRSPELAEVLQLEASGTESDWTSLHRAGREPQATFGHFRRRATPGASAPSREHWLRTCLAQGVRLNPDGVILFSTRSMTHIDEMAAAMASVEQQG